MSSHERKRKTGRRKYRRNGAALAAGIVVLSLALAFLAASLIVTYSGRIFPNVCADGIPLGGMDRQGALNALAGNGWQEKTGNILTVRTFRGAAVEIDPVKAGTVLDAESAVDAALACGRGGSIFGSFASWIRSFGIRTDVNELYRSPDAGYIAGKAEELQSNLDSALGEMYRLDGQNVELVMIKGQGSMFLNRTELVAQIGAALESGQSELTFADLVAGPVRPDFPLIHSLVCTGPSDARFSDDGSHTVIDGGPGYEFDISEAGLLWDAAEPGGEVRIPLAVSYSGVTRETLESRMYHDLLGAVTTKYNNSGENRRSNVRLAASKIDGTVIWPGEEFSFNDVVGKRTAEAGFLLAPAYAGYDDIKEEIGGGVCQVSTGVYASALFAFLEITSHTCHVYPPNYIQLGTDATVTIPEGGGRTIDLRFRNSKTFPVKIVSYCEEVEDRGDGRPLRTLTVEIWGTLEDDDYMPVEFDNSWGDVYDYDRVIDPPYPDREGVKLKLTHDEQEFEDDYGKGIRTVTYRRVYDSTGTVIEKKALNPTYSAGYAMDTYYYMG